MFFHAALLALLCGVTEFLPISSNGHVIILSELLDFKGPPGKLFEISLQFGAILAVCWLYRAKIVHTILGITRDTKDRRFALNVVIACLPATLVGALFHRFITEHLFHAHMVASMLVAGGVIILLVEKFKPAASVPSTDDITSKTALLIGLAQALAMVPGVSRSGATIMSAMCLGVERKAATEFSFFLAIPMICMAAGYDLLIHRHTIDMQGLYLIAAGFVIAFAVAIIVIKWLLRYLSSHTFTMFGWYRIVVGSAVLLFLSTR